MVMHLQKCLSSSSSSSSSSSRSSNLTTIRCIYTLWNASRLAESTWQPVNVRTQTAMQTCATRGSSTDAYPYHSGDGRQQKATLEHVFKPDDAASSAGDGSGYHSTVVHDTAAPWAVGWQMNERNLVWNDQLKLQLIKRASAEKLGLSDGELEQRLATITLLLPDLADRLARAPPTLLAQLAANTDTLAARLLRLKLIFPEANVSALVTSRLTLLLEEDLDEVEEAAVRLRQLLAASGVAVDAFVEAHPQVLFVDDFEAALQDAERLMPDLDLIAALRSNPDLVLSFQKGAHLIPYDPPWPIHNQQA